MSKKTITTHPTSIDSEDAPFQRVQRRIMAESTPTRIGVTRRTFDDAVKDMGVSVGGAIVHGGWSDSPSIITVPAHGFEVLKVAMRTTRIDDGFDLVWVWNVTSFDQFEAIRSAMQTGDIGALREVAQANPAIDWRSIAHEHATFQTVGHRHPDALAYVQQLAEVQP
jgi:hypothetical protein